MTDVELAALAALVNRETVELNMQQARYGEFRHSPDTQASIALDAELYRRGLFVVPVPEGAATKKIDA